MRGDLTLREWCASTGGVPGYVLRRVLHTCVEDGPVWIGRSSSVLNLPSAIHSAPVRFFRLCDLVSPPVWWKVSRLCVFTWNILHWSWDRTVVFVSHSPILSRFSFLLRYQSLVKVVEIAPFWCDRNVPSIFILSFFLELWLKSGHSFH